MTSFTSLRSKNSWPPYIVYGTACWRSSSSRGLAWMFER
jgi:hypothetical protein